MNLKVVLFAPIHTSLYARLVLDGMLKEDSVEVQGIVVRNPWNFKRITSEFRRDGSRLVRKFIRKYLLREGFYREIEIDNLAKLSQESELKYKNLFQFTEAEQIPLIKADDLNEASVEDFLKEKQPDVIVFTGGGLVRKNILDIPKFGVLNCHTGVLPKYRGMDVVEWTGLEEAVESSGFGVTVHYMVRSIDAGPILLVRKITPDSKDNYESIRVRLEVLMVNTMLETVKGIADGTIKAVPQKKEEGRQYFVMHPRIKQIAELKLKTLI